MSAPYMPFYIGDYIRDTLHLTTEQHGAYLLLIFAMFTGGGFLPNDERKLARIARLSNSKWATNRDDLMSFFTVECDVITHKKITEVSKKYNEKLSNLAKNGAKGGRSKSLKTNKQALANAKDLPEQMLYQPEPEPYILDTDVSNRNAREPLGDFETFWKAWPHKVGKPAAVKSYQSAIKRGHSHEQVMEGLRRYIRGKPPDRSWLNPATFLNQERYNDEPASSHNNQTSHTTINPDGSPSAETFGRTIPFPNKQGLGGRAGAALRSLQERAGMDRDW